MTRQVGLADSHARQLTAQRRDPPDRHMDYEGSSDMAVGCSMITLSAVK